MTWVVIKIFSKLSNFQVISENMVDSFGGARFRTQIYNYWTSWKAVEYYFNQVLNLQKFGGYFTYSMDIAQLSSVLNKKDQSPTNHTFEQKEVLLNNTDLCIGAQILQYQNMQQMYLIKTPQRKILEGKCYKDLVNIWFQSIPP